jgi:dihydrodipicolinate synthase/N-acetylneuraminate lyase
MSSRPFLLVSLAFPVAALADPTQAVEAQQVVIQEQVAKAEELHADLAEIIRLLEEKKAAEEAAAAAAVVAAQEEATPPTPTPAPAPPPKEE